MLAVAAVLVAIGLVFHPVPAGGMTFFAGVALINGWVMHFLVARGAPAHDPLLYDAFNRLLIGYGWLGNPLFLLGLTTLAAMEVRHASLELPRWIAWAGLVFSILSWGRGIGSATGPAGVRSLE